MSLIFTLSFITSSLLQMHACSNDFRKISWDVNWTYNTTNSHGNNFKNKKLQNNYNTCALLTLIIINSSKICSSFPPQPVPCTLNTKQRLSLQNKGKHREVTCISHIKLAQTWMTEVVKVLQAGLAIWILILTSQTSQALTVRTQYQLLFTSGAREKCCLLCSYFHIFFYSIHGVEMKNPTFQHIPKIQPEREIFPQRRMRGFSLFRKKIVFFVSKREQTDGVSPLQWWGFKTWCVQHIMMSHTDSKNFFCIPKSTSRYSTFIRVPADSINTTLNLRTH